MEFLATQVKVRTQTIDWVQRNMCFGVAKEVTLLSAFSCSEGLTSFLFSHEFISIKARQDHLCQMVENKNAQKQQYFFNLEQEIMSKIGLPWNLLSLFSQASVSMNRDFFSSSKLTESTFFCLPVIIVKNKQRKTEKETNNQWCILSSG